MHNDRIPTPEDIEKAIISIADPEEFEFDNSRESLIAEIIDYKIETGDNSIIIKALKLINEHWKPTDYYHHDLLSYFQDLIKEL